MSERNYETEYWEAQSHIDELEAENVAPKWVIGEWRDDLYICCGRPVRPTCGCGQNWKCDICGMGRGAMPCLCDKQNQ